MKPNHYALSYIDEFGDTQDASFTHNEYHNLMELLFDKYLQEWGDCKGRAWCGTCHIQIIAGHTSSKISDDEKHTLSKLDSSNANSRLACQIPINAELHQMAFKVISENDYGSYK